MKNEELDELMKKRKFTYVSETSNHIRLYSYENSKEFHTLVGIAVGRDEFRIGCRDKATMYLVETPWIKGVDDKSTFKAAFLRVKRLLKIVLSELEEEE